MPTTPSNQVLTYHASPRIGMRRSRWLIPLGFFGLGMLLFVGGFAWAIVSGVAIPDQDPSPEMQRYAAFHDGIAKLMVLTSLVLISGAIVWALILLLQWLIRSLHARFGSSR